MTIQLTDLCVRIRHGDPDGFDMRLEADGESGVYETHCDALDEVAAYLVTIFATAQAALTAQGKKRGEECEAKIFVLSALEEDVAAELMEKVDLLETAGPESVQ